MGRPRKEELRELKEEEQKELKRVVKATSERVDTVKRAKALLVVAAGATLTKASQEAGLSREAVAQMVTRFNRCGLAVQTYLPVASDACEPRLYGGRKIDDILQEQRTGGGCRDPAVARSHRRRLDRRGIVRRDG